MMNESYRHTFISAFSRLVAFCLLETCVYEVDETTYHGQQTYLNGLLVERWAARLDRREKSDPNRRHPGFEPSTGTM